MGTRKKGASKWAGKRCRSRVWDRGTTGKPSWWIRFRTGDGQRIAKRATRDDGTPAAGREEAEDILIKAMAAYRTGASSEEAAPPSRRGRVLLRDLLARFTAEYEGTKVKNLVAYRAESKVLLAYVPDALANRYAIGIKVADIKRLRDGLLRQVSKRTKRPLSKQTVRHVLNRLSKAYGWAIGERLVLRNPVSDVDLPAVPRPSAPLAPEQYLEVEEVQRLLNWTQQHAPDYHPIFAVAVTTGMRPNELVGNRRRDLPPLLWKDVDLKRGRITLRASKTSTEVERIALHPVALAALREWRKRDHHEDGRPVFAFPYFGVPHQKTIWKHLHLCLDGAKVRRIPVYGLRHTAGTVVADNGGDLLEVSSLLRHASLETTRRYVHARERRAAAAVARINLTIPKEVAA